MFSKPEGARISEKYVAVRLLGGNDLDEEGEAFMKRYGVGGYPTLLAMTSDGAVIGREFGRTAEGILAGMDRARTADEQFHQRHAELKNSKDPEAVRELADMYMERAQHEEARTRFEQLVSTSAPALDDQLALLEILEQLDDTAARKALLTTLIQTRKGDERNIDWRMDLATADLPTQVTSREEWEDVMGKRKEEFTKLLASVTQPADQAVVRHSLASVLANTGDLDGAIVHWEWILANARDSRVAPDALWIMAQQKFKKARDPFTGNRDIAMLEQAKTMLREIVDKHADHPLAERAENMALPAVDKAIDEQRTKDEAEKAKDPEEGGDPDGG